MSSSMFPATRLSRPGTYCEAVGRIGGFLGDESGEFEVWFWPLRVAKEWQVFCTPVHDKVILPAPLSAARVEFLPDGLELVYALPQTTLRQRLHAWDESGALICSLRVETSVPVLFGVQFVADLVPMWPASLGGRYSLWDEERGAYLLTEGRRKCAALVGSPGGRRVSELVAHEPPGTPLALAYECPAGEGRDVPIFIVLSLNGWEEVRSRFDDVAQRWRSGRRPESGDGSTGHAKLRGVLEWECEAAATALARGVARNPDLGEALVAGLGPARQSYRPGFGWFFGGDAAINSLALLPLGLHEATQRSLEFFARYQRADGRIAHEISQAAAWVDWFGEYPYAFIHADTTPYFILCAAEYLKWTGDEQSLRALWPAVRKAFEYCLRLDTDNDGLIENSAAGLGALELGSLLANIHVDIYLASVWTAALRELAWTARYLGETEVAERAGELFEAARSSLNERFWSEESGGYEFAVLTNGELLREPTAWSTIPLVFGLAGKPTQATVRRIASADLVTDWGVRMVGKSSPHYDPVGYNNGAVWPFLTGLVAWALYREHRSEAARQLLEAGGQLHFDFAYGLAHEVLSGDFYCPLPASVPHQLFSSSTFAAALLRGMLGIDLNVPENTMTVAPHLPPGQRSIALEHVAWRDQVLSIEFEKTLDSLRIIVRAEDGSMPRVRWGPSLPAGSRVTSVKIDGREVEYGLGDTPWDVHVRVASERGGRERRLEVRWQGGVEVEVPRTRPWPGDCSRNLRLVDHGLREGALWLCLEAPGGADMALVLHTPLKPMASEGYGVERLDESRWLLRVRFPGDPIVGYVRKELEVPLKEK